MGAEVPPATLRIGEICAESLPPGVLNVVVDDNDLGARLTSHPDVAKVSFTGSTVVGRRIMAAAAETIKRLTLELGGNDAAIVLDDVSPKEVAAKILWSFTVLSGQNCMATKRLFVPGRLYDEVSDELAHLANAVVVGDGLEPETQMGPIQNLSHFERTKQYLAIAKRDGTVVAGGNVVDRKGYFVRPTVVRDITDDSPLVRDEQFAPILPVLRYDDIEDAITRANDSVYGLAGMVWTGDPERGLSVARRLHTGTVWVNGMTMPFDVKDTNELAGLEPQQPVSFRLSVTETDGWVDQIRPLGPPAQLQATNAAGAPPGPA